MTAPDRHHHDPDRPAAHHGSHDHTDGDVDWSAIADTIELEGDVLGSILDQAVAILADECRRRGLEVHRVIDIGSGPGVGSTALARAFGGAEVVAVDGSEAMAARAEARFDRLGLTGRVRSVTADLPAGLRNLGPAQIVWAAMVMHHLGDERGALEAIRSVLDPGGLVVLLEFGDPLRFLPDGVEVGPAGLLDRVDALGADWVTAMRSALPDASASADYPTMLAESGFEVIADQLIGVRIDAPLGAEARAVIVNQLRRQRAFVASGLDGADAAALDVLLDPEAPDGIRRRGDVILEWSRHLFLARAVADRASGA